MVETSPGEGLCKRCPCQEFQATAFLHNICKTCGHTKEMHVLPIQQEEPEPKPVEASKKEVEKKEEVPDEEVPAIAVQKPATAADEAPRKVQGLSSAEIAAMRSKHSKEDPGLKKALLGASLGKDKGPSKEQDIRHPSPAQLRWRAIKTSVVMPEDMDSNRKCLKKACNCVGFKRNKFMATLCKNCGHPAKLHEVSDTKPLDPVEQLLVLAREEAARLKHQQVNKDPRYWSPMRVKMDRVEARVSTKKHQTSLNCHWCDCPGFWRNRFNAIVCRICGHPREAHEKDPDMLLDAAAGNAMNDLFDLIEDIKEERLESAVRIQARLRSYSAVKTLRQLKQEKEKIDSAIKIQATLRTLKAKKELEELRQQRRKLDAAIKVQAMQRARKARELAKKLRHEKLQLQRAVQIQAAWRMHKAIELANEERDARRQLAAATRIQALARMRRAVLLLNFEKQCKTEANSALKLQSSWRMHKAVIVAQKERKYRKEVQAAKTIQSVARMRAASVQLQSMKLQKLQTESALRIQSVARMRAAMLELEDLKQEKLEEDSALRLQCIYRMHQASDQKKKLFDNQVILCGIVRDDTAGSVSTMSVTRATLSCIEKFKSDNAVVDYLRSALEETSHLPMTLYSVADAHALFKFEEDLKNKDIEFVTWTDKLEKLPTCIVLKPTKRMNILPLISGLKVAV